MNPRQGATARLTWLCSFQGCCAAAWGGGKAAGTAASQDQTPGSFQSGCGTKLVCSSSAQPRRRGRGGAGAIPSRPFDPPPYLAADGAGCWLPAAPSRLCAFASQARAPCRALQRIWRSPKSRPADAIRVEWSAEHLRWCSTGSGVSSDAAPSRTPPLQTALRLGNARLSCSIGLGFGLACGLGSALKPTPFKRYATSQILALRVSWHFSFSSQIEVGGSCAAC